MEPAGEVASSQPTEPETKLAEYGPTAGCPRLAALAAATGRAERPDEWPDFPRDAGEIAAGFAAHPAVTARLRTAAKAAMARVGWRSTEAEVRMPFQTPLRSAALRSRRTGLRLRQDGHPIRNARLTPLLSALKHDAADAN